MKILFDNQIFLAQKYGGISRVFSNLIHELQLLGIETDLPLIQSYNQHLKDFPHLLNNQDPRGFLEKTLRKDPNQTILNNALTAQNFDLLHATYYNNHFIDKIGNKPFVTTIHDMIYETFPEFFSLKDKTSFAKIESAKKAKKIIAVSNSTKEKLLQFTDIKEDKIEVIHLASSLNSTNYDKNKSSFSGKKFLLYVGTREIYKNFYFTIRSLQKLLKNDEELELICFGNNFSKKELIFLENLGLKDKISAVQGADKTLIDLYKNALALVAPSYSEGFYIPLVEAMSCSCPIITNKTGPIPEVVADAAEFFDPKDSNEIAKSVEKVIYNEELREDLIRRGNERNKIFNWEKHAKKTAKLYESII